MERATVDVLSSLTDKRVVLRNAIATLGTSNGTPFYDALSRVAMKCFAIRRLMNFADGGPWSL
jgi:hypothetical protein